MAKSSQDWAQAILRIGSTAWLAGAIVGALVIFAMPGALAQMLGFRKPFNPDAATLAELREHIRARREK